MQLIIGQDIVYGNLEEKKELSRGVITKMGRATKHPEDRAVYVDHNHRLEDFIFANKCFPVEALEELEAYRKHFKELKDALDSHRKIGLTLHEKYRWE